MADVDSSPYPNQEPIPPALAPGLDLFAAAWLQAWATGGGSVSISDDGHASIYVPEYHFSPAFREIPDSVPARLAERQMEWEGANFSGRMRALLDFLGTVPAGLNAVKSHLRAHGMRYYAGEKGARS